jgi:hypothetical protein
VTNNNFSTGSLALTKPVRGLIHSYSNYFLLEEIMRQLIFILFLLTIGGLMGCTTAAERAAEADADFKEERLKILEKYQSCVDKNAGDKEKLSSCEHYLKAIDAMK